MGTKKKLISGVYKLSNIETGDFYIGRAVNLNTRKYNHFYKLRRGIHGNRFMQNSFNKYGESKFKFEIIIFCDLDRLTYYEQTLVDNLHPTFNILKECVESPRGVQRSEEFIKKQIDAKIRKEKDHLKNIFKKSGNKFSNEDIDALSTYSEVKSLVYSQEIKIKEDCIDDAFAENSVFITENELKNIQNINDFQIEKIVFILLIISKLKTFFKSSLYFGFTEICLLSKFYPQDNRIKTREKLYNLGIIPNYLDSKFNYLNSNLDKIIENSDRIIFTITNLTNAVDKLPFRCAVCGKIIERKGNRQKYCESCWINKKNETQKINIYNKRHGK
jgi:group I intron endonuclease